MKKIKEQDQEWYKEKDLEDKVYKMCLTPTIKKGKLTILLDEPTINFDFNFESQFFDMIHN